MVPIEVDWRAVSATRAASASVADRSRFEQVYDDYSGLILAYAARRTHDAEDAADVTAETFMVAWRRIDAVPPGDEARPWLWAVEVEELDLADHRGRGRNDRDSGADPAAVQVSGQRITIAETGCAGR